MTFRKVVAIMKRSLDGLIRRSADERGATLVENLGAIAIAAALSFFVGTSIWQYFGVTRMGNSQMLIGADHQTVMQWLARDVAQSQSFAPGVGAVYGTFSEPDGVTTFVYRYESSDGELVREHYEGAVLQSSTTVARHLANQADFSLSTSGGLVTVSVTPSHGGRSETLTVQVQMRVP